MLPATQAQTKPPHSLRCLGCLLSHEHAPAAYPALSQLRRALARCTPHAGRSLPLSIQPRAMTRRPDLNPRQAFSSLSRTTHPNANTNHKVMSHAPARPSSRKKQASSQPAAAQNKRTKKPLGKPPLGRGTEGEKKRAGKEKAGSSQAADCASKWSLDQQRNG